MHAQRSSRFSRILSGCRRSSESCGQAANMPLDLTRLRMFCRFPVPRISSSFKHCIMVNTLKVVFAPMSENDVMRESLSNCTGQQVAQSQVFRNTKTSLEAARTTLEGVLLLPLPART